MNVTNQLLSEKKRTGLKPIRLIVIVFTTIACSFFVLNYLFPVPELTSYSTIVTDSKGDVIHAFLSVDEKWRMKTELKEISPLLRKTILYKEDRYFYFHPGVNPLAIVRAMTKNMFRLKRTSGASTITMQVARMLKPKQRTYFNKLIEMFRAFQLEWRFSKDEILQLYLNLVPYGGNIEGVKSCSVLYFGKNPDHLSLAEITALSVIPNRPSSLRLGSNNAEIIRERNKWLNVFGEQQLFLPRDIATALDEPLSAKRMEAPHLAPHLALKLKRQQSSSRIETFLDMQMQVKLEKLAKDYVSPLYTLGIHNCAIVVIDNKTHQAKAYIGSADFNNTVDGGQVNGAAATRQPGSVLKPLVYGLCFDNGVLTPKQVVTDVPVNLNGYQPENFDSKFHGYVTVEYALENSLNVPAVKALNDLGTGQMISKLKQCRFKQVKRDENKLGLSMILGGCGVTLEEVTSLFSTFANNGVFHPTLYHSGADASYSVEQTSDTILSASANFMVTEILSRFARPDLPVNWEQSSHTPRIAWKTGTSYGKRDAWSVGYNKNYTVGVWVGNFSGVGVPELSGANIATPLLFKIFNTIDYNSSNEWFSMPGECGIRTVCSETGKLPNYYCINTVSDYFIPLVSTTKLCDNMREFSINADGKFSYCKYCLPDNGYKKKLLKVMAPEMQRYYDENRMPYEKIPPHNYACDKIFSDGGPAIRTPKNGTEYYISLQQPEPLQLSCDADPDVKTVYWFLNNEFYKQSDAKSKLFFVPDEGNVKISCTDDKGRNTDVWIKVKKVDL